VNIRFKNLVKFRSKFSRKFRTVELTPQDGKKFYVPLQIKIGAGANMPAIATDTTIP